MLRVDSQTHHTASGFVLREFSRIEGRTVIWARADDAIAYAARVCISHVVVCQGRLRARERRCVIKPARSRCCRSRPRKWPQDGESTDGGQGCGLGTRRGENLRLFLGGFVGVFLNRSGPSGLPGAE